jgi:hypothetical protein
MKKIRQRRERGLARYLCVLFGGKLRDWVSDAGRSLNFGRKKLNIIHVNSVMFFCWTHKFIDLTLNLTRIRG